ncbi:MAG: hypothetical protein WD118_09245 [Phycisphaeraceae bacterium]
MKSALVAQIWAQSVSTRMWSAAACGPPCCKQYWVVLTQVAWHL